MSFDEWKTTEQYIKSLEGIRGSHDRLLRAAKRALTELGYEPSFQDAKVLEELKDAIAAAEEHVRQ